MQKHAFRSWADLHLQNRLCSGEGQRTKQIFCKAKLTICRDPVSSGRACKCVNHSKHGIKHALYNRLVAARCRRIQFDIPESTIMQCVRHNDSWTGTPWEQTGSNRNFPGTKGSHPNLHAQGEVQRTGLQKFAVKRQASLISG